jgi:hypothetical protein
MRNKKLLFLSVGIFMIGTVSSALSSMQMILLRKNWFVRSSFWIKESGQCVSSNTFDIADFYPTCVPTTVLAALVQNGVYPDPYVGLNNMKIPDASDDFNRSCDLAAL